MFDLNLTIDSNGDAKFNADNCDGWSAANGEGESSSSNDDTCSRRASFTFSFDSDLSFDQGLTSALVTRDLFPVSRIEEPSSGWRQNEAPPPRMPVQQEVQQVQAVQARKSRRGPRSRSSQYRGVTFYRRTGRWESHIWDCGKQVYLGGFDTALAAARAYDRAAIKFRGVEADINFNLGDYDDMKQVMNLPKEEFVQMLRRQSSGFSRGSSKNRGMTLQKGGRWEARTGEFLGKKYEKAAIVCNGSNTVTSFETSKHNEETIVEPHNGGSQHDLNLNLGMSASSPKKSGCLDSLKLHHDAQTTKTLMLHAGNSASNSMSNLPLEGVPVTSQHPILRGGVDPKFVPNNEERERSGTISKLELANLAWRMKGHNQTTAASSGFSSPAPSGSASPVPFDYANTFACYWMKPFLPPS
ncbi:ethylene-responsive transcription factor RAP2-7-like isoform X2 [Salvia miltiorrhiza]|uniref:ethylene-responsive transcription factor RAP2-7-like isoform X2 n=1 Tax=Salvia miltiorrhiza TaxID=226208 RepID=UPI0025ABC16F|nr:ethylene-responsive transcription factor RAP2-7-like isoform X2 [Salvia miltiorrhiza]